MNARPARLLLPAAVASMTFARPLHVETASTLRRGGLRCVNDRPALKHLTAAVAHLTSARPLHVETASTLRRGGLRCVNDRPALEHLTAAVAHLTHAWHGATARSASTLRHAARSGL